jgi:ribonuclease III
MTEERLVALRDFEQHLSYCFKDVSLLENALTHRSFVNENGGIDYCDNERLEFLGDAVLGLCVSDMLMLEFPDYTEGQLSKLRSSVVNEQTLAELAKKFRVGDYLLLGKGEEISGGREKNSLLANTFEAMIAAIYLDCGFNETLLIVRRFFSPLIEEGAQEIVYHDYKTIVQEFAQNRFRETPHYNLIGEYGPDHDKVFEMELTLGSEITTIGMGKSKKEAEQQAAKKALELLEAEGSSKDFHASL